MQSGGDFGRSTGQMVLPLLLCHWASTGRSLEAETYADQHALVCCPISGLEALVKNPAPKLTKTGEDLSLGLLPIVYKHVWTSAEVGFLGDTFFYSLKESTHPGTHTRKLTLAVAHFINLSKLLSSHSSTFFTVSPSLRHRKNIFLFSCSFLLFTSTLGDLISRILRWLTLFVVRGEA